MSPLLTKILNLNNHAIPVETKPRYITDIVESNLGETFHGCSTILTIGIKIKTAQTSIEPVTFSFFSY